MRFFMLVFSIKQSLLVLLEIFQDLFEFVYFLAQVLQRLHVGDSPVLASCSTAEQKLHGALQHLEFCKNWPKVDQIRTFLITIHCILWGVQLQAKCPKISYVLFSFQIEEDSKNKSVCKWQKYIFVVRQPLWRSEELIFNTVCMVPISQHMYVHAKDVTVL